MTFSEAEKKVMTEKIQNAGTVVVEAKAGKGSATLSMVGGCMAAGLCAWAPHARVHGPLLRLAG